MVCKKCGAEVPGNVEKCPACGEAVTALKGKNFYCGENDTGYILYLKKKAVLFSGVIIATIATVIIALSVIISILTRIDVTDYLKIKVSGYEGKGRLSYELDTQKLAIDMFNCKNYGELTSEEKMTANKTISLLKDSIIVDGETSNLSNDDEVKIKFNNLEKISDKVDYKFKKKNEITYIVSKLSKPEKIELSTIFDTEFNGYNGKGTVKLIKKEDAILPFTIECYDSALYIDGYEFAFVTSGNEGSLSNGDTFTIEISSGEMSENYLLEQYGTYFDDSKNEYKVSDLMEIDTLDIFSHVDLSLTGLDGNAQTKVEWKSESFSQGGFTVKTNDVNTGEFEIYSDFYTDNYPLQVVLLNDGEETYTTQEPERIGTFYILSDKSSNISGGDKITFSILDYDRKVDKDSYVNYGFVFSEVEKQITADSKNLSRYVTSSDQVSVDTIKEFSENITDDIKDYIDNNWAEIAHGTNRFNSYDRKISDDFAATEAYLVCTDESSNSYSIWLLYTGTVTDSELKSGKNIYVTAVIPNPAICSSDKSELIVNDGINMGYYQNVDDIKSSYWYKNNKVTVFNLKDGTVEEASKEQRGTIKVNNGYLNVREIADLNGAIVGKLHNGDEVIIYEESEDGKWLSIKSGDINGYVSKEYVKLN